MANPVLQRELIANLRTPRAFVLQGAFVLLLGAIVVLAWPAERKIDLTNPGAARELFELFIMGQFLLAALTTPIYAAGSIAGEKERKSYEMLLASALTPGRIVRAKWAASLAPSLLLIVSSLPIVMLALPLGGVSFYEVATAYLLLVLGLACFSLVSLTASAFFQRTTAALVTSFLIVLPAALAVIGLWAAYGQGAAEARIQTFLIVAPPAAAIVVFTLYGALCRRLWYPPDVGSEGREVVDEQEELRHAVGLVIRRDEFPDRLFAPAKRTGLMPDGVNPVLDKELRSEQFSQGTLMLRLVVQISLLLAIPLMGACLYFHPPWAPWYVAYVLLFNLLVGPVFTAGAVSGERERRTLDLLLVTTLTPGTILRGKLIGGLRVSGVLTSFLLWPVGLACLLVPDYYGTLATFALAGGLVATTCLLTSVTGLAASVCFQKSSTALAAAYLALGTFFLLVPAAGYFGREFLADSPAAAWLHGATITSPFSAAFSLPLELPSTAESRPADWPIFVGHGVFQLAMIGGLTALILKRFRF